MNNYGNKWGLVCCLRTLEVQLISPDLFENSKHTNKSQRFVVYSFLFVFMIIMLVVGLMLLADVKDMNASRRCKRSHGTIKDKCLSQFS